MTEIKRDHDHGIREVVIYHVHEISDLVLTTSRWGKCNSFSHPLAIISYNDHILASLLVLLSLHIFI